MPKISQLPQQATPASTDKIPVVSGTTTSYETLASINSYLNSNIVADTALATGWVANLLPAVSSYTYSGLRSGYITFASDVSSLLYPGYKIRATRTVSAPTQCTQTATSGTKYWSKASATGYSAGTTWTIKAAIRMTAYPGTAGVIHSVDDGTNVIRLYIDQYGRIVIGGGTFATSDYVTSRESLMLNTDYDITAQITVGTPTGSIRINESDVPYFVTTSAATTVSLGATPTVYIGRDGTGNYFDGYVYSVAIFNADVTASTASYSGQAYSGSESSLLGAWNFNGNGNDAKGSNNLTATGGAVATVSRSKFGVNSNGTPTGTYDYGVVTKVSTNIAYVVMAEGCYLPSSGGITTVDYSIQDIPAGFPKDETRWTYSAYFNGVQFIQNTASIGTWYNLTQTSGTWGGMRLSLPVYNACFSVGYNCAFYTTASAAASSGYITLSSTDSSESDKELTARLYIGAAGASATDLATTSTKTKSVANTQAIYYLNVKTDSANLSLSFLNDQSPAKISAIFINY